MRSSPVVAALVLAGVVAPAAASDDERGSITATANFALGSSAVGDAPGVLAPGGHFDVGFRVRRWRLAAEVDTALWSNPKAPDDRPESGSFLRGGIALRWSALEMTTRPREGRPGGAYRIYLEGGIGRQRIDAPGLALGRNDVMLGLGIAPELSFGRVLFGANFGLRVLIANAPDDQLARSVCADCRGTRRHDLTLLYVFGFTFGR